MRVEVYNSIYVSNVCWADSDMTVVHACKAPCFVEASYIYNATEEQLFIEKQKDLYLNIIDPRRPLFKIEVFKAFLDFAEKHKEEKLLIHCNQGRSRSPSLALLLLAKREIIKNNSYETAYLDFCKMYPRYKPSKGIRTFLTQNWRQIK